MNERLANRGLGPEDQAKLDDAVERARNDALSMLSVGSTLTTRVKLPSGQVYEIESLLAEEFYDDSRYEGDTHIQDRGGAILELVLPEAA